MAFEDLRIEMKCKDFRIEVEEGLKGDSLSIVAQDHAAGCRPCHEFNQKHIEFREWLTVCRKVTAPKDFQFGVKRKIAGAEAAHTHGWVWDRLRYIVPATAFIAVLVLAGFYLFNSGLINGNGQGVATLDTNVGPARAGSDEARTPENIAKPESAKPGEEIAAANTSKPESNSRVTPTQEQADRGGGSKTFTANVQEQPKYPQGLHASPNEGTARSLTLNDLRDKGVVTNLQMQVILILPNTPGARAGVKKGDIVKGLNGSVVTIIRDGQTLQIKLK